MKTQRKSRGPLLSQHVLSLIWDTARKKNFLQDCELRDRLWLELKREYSESTFRKWLPKSSCSYQTPIHPSAFSAIQRILDIQISDFAENILSTSSDALPPLPNYYSSNTTLQVDFSQLPEDQKAILLRHYQTFLPQPTPINWICCPSETQKSLQNKLPIDTSFITRLTSKKNIDIHFPINRVQMHKIGIHIQNALRSTAKSEYFSESFRSIISELHDYLSCDDHNPSIKELPKIDAVIIIGARLSAKGRVQKAIDTLRHIENGVVFMCGGYPTYESKNPLPVAEADVLNYLYTRAISNDPFLSKKRVILERRPRNLLEAAACLQSTFRSLSASISRPIKIGIVTSPYAMRRTMMIFENFFLSHPSSLIDSLVPLVATSEHLGRHMLFDRFTDNPNDDRYKYEVFVTEYLKLIGGRVAGDY